MSNCCSHGTFPHFGLQSSRLNICYYHQDLHRRRLHPGSRPRLRGHLRALLLVEAGHSPRRPGMGTALERHPFSGLVDSAGELLHTLLSGFRLPWPPSCCLDQPTPFMVSDERRFGHLNPASGSSRIASSAYQKWPTRNPGIPAPTSLKQAGLLTHLKFENRLRLFQPQDL